MNSLLFILATQLPAGSQCPVIPEAQVARPGAPPIVVGWHDELNSVKLWKPLAIENKPKVSVPVAGALRMDLAKVPAGWPYEYQWSGVTRDAMVDVGRFPFLSANVSLLLGGYAHMDIDVLDVAGNAVKHFRSSTLQAGGLTFIDLSTSLDPAIYRLRLRLIVGGSNEGCYATYTWVRFTSVKDGERLRSDPNYRWIVEARAIKRKPSRSVGRASERTCP